MRDGIDSANLHAMNSVSGQSSWNFFELDFSNHIAAPGSGLFNEAVKMKFATSGTYRIVTLGLSNLASYGQDGVEESEVVLPY